jgi:hypothetical protein
LVNKATTFPKSKTYNWYKRYGCRPVKNNLESKNFRVIEKDFTAKTTLFRHDPGKVAKTVVELL